MQKEFNMFNKKKELVNAYFLYFWTLKHDLKLSGFYSEILLVLHGWRGMECDIFKTPSNLICVATGRIKISSFTKIIILFYNMESSNLP